jgi:ornithine carbamoyltransferase
MPIINAMTDNNHPCEMMSDLYALSKIRENFLEDQYLYVGAPGNIGYAWMEASKAMGFSLEQACPKGYEIEGLVAKNDLYSAMKNKDIICTDSLSSDKLLDFKDFQITLNHMSKANQNAVLNPCPPFFRGEEVAGDVVDSSYFVGYQFKESLLEIQQAIMIFAMKE